MKKQIKNNVYFVGKVDHDLRKFHGSEYSTFKGSSYNSFLVIEDKVALLDTVWGPFANEFVENLEREIDLNKIDYIIANHGETDHSGAMPLLMERIPDKPIFCTEAGIKSIKGQYHKDWNFIPVKTGDKISLGSKELIFISAPMLHWPDTMFTYLTGDNILFSNDAFGQHFSSEHLFNNMVDQETLFYEAIKYYANILTPFNTLVTKKINEILAMNIPIDIIWNDETNNTTTIIAAHPCKGINPVKRAKMTNEPYKKETEPSNKPRKVINLIGINENDNARNYSQK